MDLAFKFNWSPVFYLATLPGKGAWSFRKGKNIQKRKESGKASGRGWYLSRTLMGRLDLDTQRWTAQESTPRVHRGHYAFGPGTDCLSRSPERLTGEAGMWAALLAVGGINPKGGPGGAPQHPL